MRRLGCLGLLAILLAVVAGFSGLHMWGGRGPLARIITVTVAPGSSLATTSEQLEKAGAISSASRFRLFARFLGGSGGIKAGEYRIPAHLSQADILKVLQGTKTVQRFVTIPEGWPSVMVRDAGHCGLTLVRSWGLRSGIVRQCVVPDRICIVYIIL